MRRYLLTAALLTTLAAPAIADGLTPRSYGTAARVSGPFSIWTGCYLGGHAGGIWDSSDGWVVRTPGGAFVGQSLGAHDLDGWVGGAQVGCDYQFTGSRFVIGIQADYGWTDAKGSHASAREIGVAYHSDLKSLATVTGRVGHAWDRFLGYVKAGGAWSSVDYSASTILVGTAYTAERDAVGMDRRHRRRIRHQQQSVRLRRIQLLRLRHDGRALRPEDCRAPGRFPRYRGERERPARRRQSAFRQVEAQAPPAGRAARRPTFRHTARRTCRCGRQALSPSSRLFAGPRRVSFRACPACGLCPRPARNRALAEGRLVMQRRSFLIGSSAAAAAVHLGGFRVAMAQAKPGELVWADNLPAGLDPHVIFDVPMQFYMLNVYDQLYQYEGNPPQLKPWLASGHTVSPDGLVWTITLRDAKFHDGSPITAEDVVYSFRRLLDHQAWPIGRLPAGAGARQDHRGRRQDRQVRAQARLPAVPLGDAARVHRQSPRHQGQREGRRLGSGLARVECGGLRPLHRSMRRPTSPTRPPT